MMVQGGQVLLRWGGQESVCTMLEGEVHGTLLWGLCGLCPRFWIINDNLVVGDAIALEIGSRTSYAISSFGARPRPTGCEVAKRPIIVPQARAVDRTGTRASRARWSDPPVLPPASDVLQGGGADPSLEGREPVPERCLARARAQLGTESDLRPLRAHVCG